MTEIWFMLVAVAVAFAAIGWLCRGLSARASYARGFRDGKQALADEIRRQFFREISKPRVSEPPKDS